MLGKKLADMDLEQRPIPHFGVKEAVFPFNAYPEVDPVLGPEMRSTGEVLGLADSFGLAFHKSQEAAQPPLPAEGTVLMSIAEKTEQVAEIGRGFAELGFKIRATTGTHRYLAEHGVPSERIWKLTEGRPNIVDEIVNGQIDLVINTPIGRRSQIDDSYIRKAAIKYKVPYITTLAAATATVTGIAEGRKGHGQVRPLQSYHADIGR
jgi:carbamoyl-phosphate synthase large subunit